MAKRAKPKSKPKRRRTGRRRIWSCGRVPMPAYVMDEAEPYRPDVLLCVERPERFVLAYGLSKREGDGDSVAEVVQRAMAEPLVGRPRRPDKIFVSDPALAAELAPTGVEVAVGPTPEIAQIARSMFDARQGGDAEPDLSYLEGGRVSAKTVARMFEAATALYEEQPWALLADDEVFRLDIPDLGARGACVSVLGAAGESFGFVVFPSGDAFLSFQDAAERIPRTGGPVNLGTPLLSLNFERGANLPPRMRREAAKHGWPVADARAYPWPQHVDADGLLRPTNERDVLVVTLCARALARLVGEHRSGLLDAADAGRFLTVHETVDGHDVELSFPYHPEGSLPDAGWAPAHAMDEHLVALMRDFAEERFGRTWQRHTRSFDNPEATIQLLNPWSVYGFDVEGRPVVDWFIEERGEHLTAQERQWLSDQRFAWLGVWEIADVTPGEGVVAVDRLSGESRTIRDVSASRTLRPRDSMLARVIDSGGVSLLCGLHPRTLAPSHADRAVQAIRKRLRRKGDVPVERLRDSALGKAMIEIWEEMVDEADAQRAIPPQLSNTDGEPYLITIDHFRFSPQDRTEIEGRLARMEGMLEPEQDGDARVYTLTAPGNAMHRSWDNTIVARVSIRDSRIQIEANSVERADRVRERVVGVLESLVEHEAREHSDPLSSKVHPARSAEPEPPATESERQAMMEALAAFKAEHYASWVDQPIPALGGRSPREAARTKRGREQVDLLLKDIEHHEAALPADERFDFAPIRHELHLGK